MTILFRSLSRRLRATEPCAWLGVAAACLSLLAAGCADGPVPEMRVLNPWVRKQWAEDEKFGPTFHKRVADLKALQSRAASMSPEERQQVSAKLAAELEQEQSSAMRLEILRVLGDFPTQTSFAAAEQALTDANPQVRVAACRAMGHWNSPQVLQALGNAVGGDSDLDVRIAATRSLKNFKDPAAVHALSIALDDRDPALQKVAMESLRETTGKDYGMSVVAWREYVKGGNPTRPPPPSIASRLQDLWLW